MDREEYQFRAGDTEDGISVLIPTRKRGELLLKSIATLRDNAQAPWQVEFLVAYDNDDTETPRAIKGHDYITGINVGERRGWKGLHLYYADLISYAKTDWYVMWCDDGLMHTPNWDVIARAQKPGVLHVQGGPAGNHNVYPIIHRKVVEGVKYVLPTPHTDTWWTEIAAGAGILYQVPIAITEDRFNETGNNNDQTYQEGSVHQYRQPEYYSAEFMDERHFDMFRLAEACTTW